MNTTTKNSGQHPIPAPGNQAPEFTLRCTPDQSVALSEFRGRPVVLAFYPADWSPVCGDQMALYNEMLDEFSGVSGGSPGHIGGWSVVSLGFRETE